MTHIFVSYTAPDSSFADTLFRQLHEAGFMALIDSEQVRQGGEWSAEIDRAIEDAFALIVVMSPAAKASESVTYEWTYALRLRKPIIPIMLEPAGLHPRLSSLPCLDFTSANSPWDDLIQLLKRVEVGQHANQMIAALHHPNWETRMVVAEILGNRRDPAAISALAEALYDEYLEVRIAAAKALAKIGHPDAVPYLIKAVRANDDPVRVMVLWALGKIGDASAVSELVKALRDPSTQIRWNAAWALGEIGGPAIPGLVKALRDPDGRVRGTAAGALAAMGVADIVPELVMALRDDKWSVREAAARALGQLRDAAAVHGLIEALRDGDERVRGTAGAALAAIGGPAAPALAQALNDEDGRVRLAATGALGVIGRKVRDEAIGQALLGALEDRDHTVRAVAAWALGELENNAWVPALAGVLWNDRHGNVRAAAFKALARLDTPEAREAIAHWQREVY